MSTTSNSVVSAFEDAMMSLPPKFVRKEDNLVAFEYIRNTRPSFNTGKGKGYSNRKSDSESAYAAYVALMNS